MRAKTDIRAELQRAIDAWGVAQVTMALSEVVRKYANRQETESGYRKLYDAHLILEKASFAVSRETMRDPRKKRSR